MVEYPQTFISISKTATSDAKFNLCGISDMWFSELNVHCATNNALYGDVHNQDAPINANDVMSFRDCNLKDIFFKNASAGSNCVIYAVGSLMMEGRREWLLGQYANVKRI